MPAGAIVQRWCLTEQQAKIYIRPIEKLPFLSILRRNIVEDFQMPNWVRSRSRVPFEFYALTEEKFHSSEEQALGEEQQVQHGNRAAACIRRNWISRHLQFFPCLFVSLALARIASGQSEPVNPAAPLPNAPLPVIKHGNSKVGPCRMIPKSESAGRSITEVGFSLIATLGGMSPIEQAIQPAAAGKPAEAETVQALPPCAPPPLINFFNRFINGPEVKPLTPKEKARLAVRNLLDPFNAVTILGNSAIAVGSDSHSAYGPGMPGFARYVGVSYSEDTTGEFFGTFLIPSVLHQDPHYHREPHLPIPHRILHAIAQVGWTQGDNGKGMPNYSNLLGYPICAAIANLYVPGERTNVPSTAARVTIGLAISPTDNFITEFLPDVARHIHVRIVVVQQIINQVARTEPGGLP
jgi:hypothetical protein